jgi:tetratricopeptide (TPR) repeat protein
MDLDRASACRFKLAILAISLFLAAGPRALPATLPKMAEKQEINLPFRNEMVIIKLLIKDGPLSQAAALMRTDPGRTPQFDEAETILRSALEQPKPMPEIWLALGVACEAQGKLEQAKKAYLGGLGTTSLIPKITLKEECEAGLARLQARQVFARKQKEK